MSWSRMHAPHMPRRRCWHAVQHRLVKHSLFRAALLVCDWGVNLLLCTVTLRARQVLTELKRFLQQTRWQCLTSPLPSRMSDTTGVPQPPSSRVTQRADAPRASQAATSESPAESWPTALSSNGNGRAACLRCSRHLDWVMRHAAPRQCAALCEARRCRLYAKWLHHIPAVLQTPSRPSNAFSSSMEAHGDAAAVQCEYISPLSDVCAFQPATFGCCAGGSHKGGQDMRERAGTGAEVRGRHCGRRRRGSVSRRRARNRLAAAPGRRQDAPAAGRCRMRHR